MKNHVQQHYVINLLALHTTKAKKDIVFRLIIE